MSAIIETAKKTIFIERDALTALAAQVNEQFEKAVQTIDACKGRVVASGIGKSAIIAQKMVATFNSTGTPAVFMHAADAMHGDLGIIQKNDVVIIISKSGESPEIKGLLPLIKNADNCIIAIVGNMQSQLAKQSDIVLNSFVSQEACPHNLAPTASTTAQMALGDALAVCLMELKKFSPKDFARLHPGGNLGKRLYLRVADIYKNNAAPKVLADTDLKNVILEISKGRVGATAVVDENNIVKGIITDGDVRRLLEKTEQLSDITAKDILSSTPKCILPETLAIEALELIKQYDLSQLIVIDNKRYFLGFIHLHDLIREGIY